MTASACTLTVTASACASSCHVRWVLALASQETFATPRVASRGAAGSRHPEIPNTQHTHTAHIRTKHTLDTVRGKHAWNSRRNVLQRIYNIKFAHLSCYYCNSLFHSFVYFIIFHPFHPFVHFTSFHPLHPFHHFITSSYFLFHHISSHFILLISHHFTSSHFSFHHISSHFIILFRTISLHHILKFHHISSGRNDKLPTPPGWGWDNDDREQHNTTAAVLAKFTEKGVVCAECARPPRRLRTHR